MNTAMRNCLRTLYKTFDLPADRLLNSPRREDFAAEVRRMTSQSGLATAEIMRRLLNLRRSRGLPRLRKRARARA